MVLGYSMEASIVQAVKAELHGARLPSQDNVCREKTSQQVASVVQPEPAMLHEDEWDLEIPVVDAMLPANCHSAQPSCVLGPRAQVPGTKEADGVPSTNVHIGNGLFVCASKWTWVSQAKTDSTFAREIVRCLWQPKELLNRSVTGKICMRKLKEGGEAKPALTPQKLSAVRKAYEHFVSKNPSAVDTDARRLKDLNNKHLATMLRDAK
ncbi:hypothetical protein HPB49_010749 [Dermacentor silvarum]|uniref:Uncharacterized protein n=1 Tax=Dermacentor silvarum TaxID=543639 RepID=A0ACB8DZC4_DERSI|nr:hypothetical protein HPB49_010749 [Dermacentor silvarum]